MGKRQERVSCSPHFPAKNYCKSLGFPCIHRFKFDAFFYIDNMFDNFKIPLFDIDNIVNNLKSADISAYDNNFPIYIVDP